jgi:succinate dehydrogenase/fumarate reductase flavoprotein subunit
MHRVEGDVVVIGMGAAGLAAAITALDAGEDVVVVEKLPAQHAGGNSRVSGQVWFSPDDAKLAAWHLRELCGEYPVADALAEAWARETATNNDWVAARALEVRGTVAREAGDPYHGDGTDITTMSYGELGANVGGDASSEYEFPELSGNDCGVAFNFIGPTQGFSRLWHTLKAALDWRGARVLYDTQAIGLVSCEGEIVGVECLAGDGEALEIRARKATILASGGFAGSAELTREFLRLPRATPWGSPANTGDGIKMAQKVGAGLSHPYNYMAVPGLRMEPHGVGDYGQPADGRFISVGADGRRFADELAESRHGKTPTRGTLDFFPGVPMWTVFDEDGRLAGPLVAPRSAYATGWAKQVEGYEWSADNGAEIERGWIKRADTIRELAEELGIDPDGLESELERYNAHAREGSDPDFARDPRSLVPIERGPFYGYAWAQLLITTLGGIRKDEHARALDPYGEAIPRLYCAGDTASTYTWCLSGGMGLADAMAFGRIAARHASAQTPHDHDIGRVVQQSAA